jgi:hypothetical protein
MRTIGHPKNIPSEAVPRPGHYYFKPEGSRSLLY